MSSCTKGDRPSPRSPVTLTLWHTFGGDMRPVVEDLVDQFNEMVGRENGVTVVIEAVVEAPELDDMLLAAADGEPGVPELPDVSFIHPFLLPSLTKSDLVVDLSEYFTKEELAAYVPAYLEDGVWEGRHYVLPAAKACDVLYVNSTFFSRFTDWWFREHGEQITDQDMAVYEDFIAVAEKYYQYTDALTPDIPHDGKALYAADSNYTYLAAGTEQLGGTIFDKAHGRLDFSSEAYRYVFAVSFSALVNGYCTSIYGYGNYLMLTGDIITTTTSSGEGSYFSDFVVHPDNSVEQVEYDVLPFPVFRGGKKISLRRGVGMGILKKTPVKEYAAALFLKWFTADEANLKLCAATGFLPVRSDAYETEAFKNISFRRPVLEKAFRTALEMEKEYRFFQQGGFDGYMEQREAYYAAAGQVMDGVRGGRVTADDADRMINMIQAAVENSGGNQ